MGYSAISFFDTRQKGLRVPDRRQRRHRLGVSRAGAVKELCELLPLGFRRVHLATDVGKLPWSIRENVVISIGHSHPCFAIRKDNSLPSGVSARWCDAKRTVGLVPRAGGTSFGDALVMPAISARSFALSYHGMLYATRCTRPGKFLLNIFKFMNVHCETDQ